MNAQALRVEEQAAPYLVAPVLTDQLDTFAGAPDGFKRLRELVLNLAVRGRLVPQDANDEPADELLKRIADEKRKLLAADSIRSEKTSEEIDEAELPFCIPNSWQWVRLSDLAWPQAGFAFKANLFNDAGDGLPLIRIRDVGAEGVKTYFSGEYRDEFVVENGDWLVSMDGQFRVARWHGSRALLNQRVSRLVFYGYETQQRLICIALQHELLKLQGQKAYTTVDHLSGGQIASRPIPLPPAAEQSRIVAKVEEVMALIDRLEARVSHGETARRKLLDALLTALADSPNAAATADAWAQLAPHFDLLLQTPADVDRLQQTLLTLAVKGRLVPQDPNDEPAAELLKRIRAAKERLVAEGRIKRDKSLPEIGSEEPPYELPPGWSWARFPEVGEFGRGKSKHRPRNDPVLFSGGAYPLVQTGEVARATGRITSFSARYNDAGLAQSRLWPAGTLCITIAANIADCAILGIDACFPDSVVGFVPSQEIGDAKYFELFMKTAKEHLLDYAPSTAQKNINLEILNALLIPVPPVCELHRIVAAVASLTALCDRLRERLAARRALSTKLATALTETALQ